MGAFNIGFSTDSTPIQMGATYTLNATLYNSSTSGSRYNLTGYGVRSKIRERYDSTAVVASFTAAILAATAGPVRLSLTAVQTAALTEGYYVYDAEAYSSTTSTATVLRFLEGRVQVTPEVTY